MLTIKKGLWSFFYSTTSISLNVKSDQLTSYAFFCSLFLSVHKNTKLPALLIEIDFISNKEVENNLRNDNHLKNIADTISSTLLSFVNKSIVEDKVFYRICIGSFSNKDNAVNLKNEAICKGFKDTHIYTT